MRVKPESGGPGGSLRSTPNRRAEERSEAPALEKGLDIIETLAERSDPLSQKALAEQIGRSVTEIFRMLTVLERRGYILRAEESGHYTLSRRLFELANRHPPTRRLQRVALPVMEELARASHLSCHMIVLNRDRMLVIAQADPDLPMSWTVKLGATFPFAAPYVSARILAAFQPASRRARLVEVMAAQEQGATPAEIAARLVPIAERGYDLAASDVTVGITDVSFPILDNHGHAMAALTIAWLPQRNLTPSGETLVDLLRAAAGSISEALGGSGQDREEPAGTASKG